MSLVADGAVVSEGSLVVVSFVEVMVGSSVEVSVVVISEDTTASEEISKSSSGFLLVQAHKDNSIPAARKMTKKRGSLFIGMNLISL